MGSYHLDLKIGAVELTWVEFHAIVTLSTSRPKMQNVAKMVARLTTQEGVPRDHRGPKNGNGKCKNCNGCILQARIVTAKMVA